MSPLTGKRSRCGTTSPADPSRCQSTKAMGGDIVRTLLGSAGGSPRRASLMVWWFRGEGSNPYMRDQNPLSYH